ncbi:MAG: hypothetical protein KJ587_08860 [Alphaproteobacteria bacterium]|nr:hypothetical protein [Alphaproteobacteria bacterium]
MQRVALLIPTFNRSLYLARQLSYLKKHFAPDFYKVCVLDGSKKNDERERNKLLATEFGVECFWYDSANVSIYQRLIAGAELVQCDYIQVVPDDDYFSEAAIRYHVEMLDNSPAAVGAFGHVLSFREVNNLGDENHRLHLRLPVCENRPDYIFDHPISNIFYAVCEKGRGQYYCLHRRDVLIKSLRVAQVSSVLLTASSDHEHAAQIDSRCYYFGDLAMTVMPLILGKKMNSGLPSVGYQTGQSFDVGDGAKKHEVPERLPHHRLLLDPSFEFGVRARKFIATLGFEYLLAHPASDTEAVDEFFTHITMSFFGSLAANSVLLRTYNQAGHKLGVAGRMRIRAVQSVTQISKSVWLDKIDGAKALVPKTLGACHITDDYRFLIDDITAFYKTGNLEVATVGNVDIEVAHTLYSFERPTPYGARPKPNAAAKRHNKIGRSGGVRSYFRLARRWLTLGADRS